MTSFGKKDARSLEELLNEGQLYDDQGNPITEDGDDGGELYDDAGQLISKPAPLAAAPVSPADAAAQRFAPEKFQANPSTGRAPILKYLDYAENVLQMPSKLTTGVLKGAGETVTGLGKLVNDAVRYAEPGMGLRRTSGRAPDPDDPFGDLDKLRRDLGLETHGFLEGTGKFGEKIGEAMIPAGNVNRGIEMVGRGSKLARLFATMGLEGAAGYGTTMAQTGGNSEESAQAALLGAGGRGLFSLNAILRTRPKEAQELMELAAEFKVPLDAAQQSQSWIMKLVKGVTKSSATGSLVLNKFDLKQNRAIAKAAAEQLVDLTSAMDPKTAGEFIQESLTQADKVARQEYAVVVDDILKRSGDVPLNVAKGSNLQSVAAELSKELELPFMSGATDVVDDVRKAKTLLEQFANPNKVVPAETRKAFQSELQKRVTANPHMTDGEITQLVNDLAGKHGIELPAHSGPYVVYRAFPVGGKRDQLASASADWMLPENSYVLPGAHKGKNVGLPLSYGSFGGSKPVLSRIIDPFGVFTDTKALGEAGGGQLDWAEALNTKPAKLIKLQEAEAGSKDLYGQVGAMIGGQPIDDGTSALQRTYMVGGDMVGPKKLTFAEAKRIRTLLFKIADSDEITIGKGAIKKLNSALDTEIADALERAGRVTDAQDFRGAGARFRGVRELLDEQLIEKMAKNGTPETILDTLLRPGAETRATTLRKLIHKDDMNQIRTALWARMLDPKSSSQDGVLLGGKLKKMLDEMGPGAKEAIFGDTVLVKKIERFASLADRLRVPANLPQRIEQGAIPLAGQFGARQIAGNTITGVISAGAGATGGLMLGAGTAVAMTLTPGAVAWMMTRPGVVDDMAKALTTDPATTAGKALLAKLITYAKQASAEDRKSRPVEDMKDWLQNPEHPERKGQEWTGSRGSIPPPPKVSKDLDEMLREPPGGQREKNQATEWPKDPNSKDENDSKFVVRDGTNYPYVNIGALVSEMPQRFQKLIRETKFGSPISGKITTPDGENVVGQFGWPFDPGEKAVPDKRNPRYREESNTVMIDPRANDSPGIVAHEMWHVIWDKGLTEKERAEWARYYGTAMRDAGGRQTKAGISEKSTPQDAISAAAIPQAVLYYGLKFSKKPMVGMDEAFSELGNQYTMNPTEFRRTYPGFYGYFKRISGGKEFVQGGKSGKGIPPPPKP